MATLLNGLEVSFCSMEVGVNGVLFSGIKSLNYKDNLEIPKGYGTSANPALRGRGQSKPEGDIEIYRKDWLRLLPILTKNGAYGYADLAWPIKVSYAEPADDTLTSTDFLQQVRLHSAEFSGAEGVDLATVKLTLDIMKIELRFNGVKYTSLK